MKNSYKQKCKSLIWSFVVLFFFSTHALAQKYSAAEKELIQAYEEGKLFLNSSEDKKFLSAYEKQKKEKQVNLKVKTSVLEANTIIFSEDFEDTVTTDNWIVEIIEGDPGWDFGSPRTPAGDLEGNYAHIDSDAAGENAGRIAATLTSPPISLENFTAELLYLSFAHVYRPFVGQTGEVQVSNDGSSWETIQKYTTLQGSTPAVGITEEFLLTGFSPDDDLYIRFLFDDNDTWGYYWYVDNVVVFDAFPQPEIVISPSVADFGTAIVGQEVAVEILFGNTGTSRLNVGSISTPDGLSASTDGFSIIPGNSTTVTFTYSSNDAVQFNDTIVLTTNIESQELFKIPARANIFTPSTNIFEDFEQVSAVSIPEFWSSTNFLVVNNHGTESSKALRANQWVLVTNANFTTKKFQLENHEDLILSFDYRVTNWVPSGPPVQPTPGQDFELNIYVMKLDGSRDHVASINADNHTPSLEFTSFGVDISNYSGEIIALYFEPTYIAGDYNIDVDNLFAGPLPDGVEPIATVLHTEIDFGAQFVDEATTQAATIQNKGVVPLTIMNATVNLPFTVDFDDELTLMPGEIYAIDVTFSSQLAGSFTEDLAISTNAVNSGDEGVLIVELQGVALDLPDFTVSTHLLSNIVTLDADGNMLPGNNNMAFTIVNQGLGELEFTIPAIAAKELIAGATTHNSVTYIDFSHEPAKGEPDMRNGHPIELNAGGGDDLGYYWIDNSESHGPLFNWVDAAENGDPVLSDTEDGNTPVVLPFAFPYYGQMYNELTVSVNGWISFDGFNGWGNINRQIPDHRAPNGLIAVLWDDLTTLNGAKVYTLQGDGYFVIQWTHVGSVNHQDASYTFQAILYEDGTMKLQYLTINGPNNTNTIGIENVEGDVGLQIAFNTDYVISGKAIVISNAPKFITNVLPASATVAAETEKEVYVQIDMSGLSEGIFTEEIVILSNDPVNSREQIIVEVEVVGVPRFMLWDEQDNMLENIAFGDVFLGNDSVFSASVVNSGTAPLVITSIEPQGEGFSYTIEGIDNAESGLPYLHHPGELLPLDIYFAPENASNYTGSLEFHTEHGENWTINLSGKGIHGPSAYIDTNGFIFDLWEGERVDTTFILGNLEKELLEFTISFASGEENIILEDTLGFPLQVNPMVGVVEGGPENEKVIDISFVGLSKGSQNFYVNITTNDPFNPMISFPVTAIIRAHELPDTIDIPQYTLNLTIAGMGEVHVNEEPYIEAITMNQGTFLTLEAIASVGWQFDGWAGDMITSSPVLSITMSNDKNLVAIFSQALSADIENVSDVAIFPNPGTGQFKITSKELITKILIFDVFGRVVYEKTPYSESAEINLRHVDEGVYLVRLYRKNGHSIRKIQIIN